MIKIGKMTSKNNMVNVGQRHSTKFFKTWAKFIQAKAEEMLFGIPKPCSGSQNLEVR